MTDRPASEEDLDTPSAGRDDGTAEADAGTVGAQQAEGKSGSRRGRRRPMDETGSATGDRDATSSESEGEEPIRRCDYCRLPIPHEPIEQTHDGATYTYCSKACRDAVEKADHVFTEYHGFRRFDPGVSALRASLPEGIPRNSFVMLSDLAGTRTEAVRAELVWRALQRGEPVVVLSLLEPPVSLLQSFVSLEWNVLPYLERDQFHIIDGFTYRVEDHERMTERMNSWNSHLRTVAAEATTTVRDPTEIRELQSRLDTELEALDMQDQGIVVIDSLTELGTLVQPVQAYNFVKDVRADICKGRFVPIFACATITGEPTGFPHDLNYMVDGIVEMRLNDELVDGALIKQLIVRKMNGVLTYPEWKSYEYTSGTGIVTFDPHEEMDTAAEGEDGEPGESDEGEDNDAGESEEGVDSEAGESEERDENEERNAAEATASETEDSEG